MMAWISADALGKLHPLVVHFPLVLGLMLPLLALWDALRPQARIPLPVHRLFWVLMLGSTGISILAGQALEESGGYPRAILEAHETGAYAVAALSLLGLLLLLFVPKTGRKPPVQLALYALLVAAVGYTGHEGGTLTHGESYTRGLFENLFRGEDETAPPVPERKRFTEPDSARVYEDLVRPILDQHCVSCHGPGRQSGGLRVDSLHTLLKASASGPMCVPGSAAKSELVHRLRLDEANTRRMPPNAPPVPEAEVALLAWWIDQGMPAGKRVAELRPDERIRKALMEAFGEPRLPALYRQDVPPASAKDLDAARKAGFRIGRVVKNRQFLEVRTASLHPDSVHSRLQYLKPLSAQIARLDLAYARLEPADLDWLAALPHLERLSLRQARFAASLPEALWERPYLEYLNLSGLALSLPPDLRLPARLRLLADTARLSR